MLSAIMRLQFLMLSGCCLASTAKPTCTTQVNCGVVFDDWHEQTCTCDTADLEAKKSGLEAEKAKLEKQKSTLDREILLLTGLKATLEGKISSLTIVVCVVTIIAGVIGVLWVRLQIQKKETQEANRKLQDETNKKDEANRKLQDVNRKLQDETSEKEEVNRRLQYEKSETQEANRQLQDTNNKLQEAYIKIQQVMAVKPDESGRVKLLGSAPKEGLDGTLVLSKAKKAIEAKGGCNVAGDAKDQFHTRIMTCEEMEKTKHQWRIAWKGKLAAAVALMQRIFPKARVQVYTIDGGEECQWELNQIYALFKASFKDIEIERCATFEEFENKLE